MIVLKKVYYSLLIYLNWENNDGITALSRAYMNLYDYMCKDAQTSGVFIVKNLTLVKMGSWLSIRRDPSDDTRAVTQAGYMIMPNKA